MALSPMMQHYLQTKEKLNYPNDASKDKWLASYSKNYSMAIHSGFDEHLKNKPTYFSSTSNVSDTLKKITKNVYSLIEKENQNNKQKTRV